MDAKSATPTVSDVIAARERIDQWINTTPLVESDELNALLGGRLLVKLESLQRSGSFKIRGALSALTMLSKETLSRGIIAFSSGNHGIAVATAARLLGSRAVVVVPDDVPRVKLQRVQANGAEVVTYNRVTEDREAICAQISDERGLTLVKPFDDTMVIAGQGSIAIEVAQQAAAMGAKPDVLVVPCSGGGLAAGCSLVLSKYLPETLIVTSEPDGFDDMARSLGGGASVTNSQATGSICDALLVRTPGRLTLPILQGVGARGVTVTDADALAAMRTALETFKVLVEPSGAVGLAAVLAGKVSISGRTVVVICSGGNADTTILAQAINDA